MAKRIKINFMKGLSPLISMVLVIGFGVAAMTIVLTVVNPMLDRAKDSAIVNEATQNMLLIDSAIKAVASESEGSKRTVNIKITEGFLRTNRSTEWVYTEFDPRSNYEIDGFTGDIKLTSRPSFLEYFNQYLDAGSATSGVWNITNGTWTVDSNRYRGIGGVAYHVFGNISDFEFTGSIAQSVEPEGQIFLLPVDPKDLVLFLPFDGNRNDTHRTAFDYGPHANNGSFLNATGASCFSSNACPNWTDAGRFGNATLFDGIGDLINVTGVSQFNSTSFSVVFWVRPDSLRVQGIIGKTSVGNPSATTQRWRFFMTSTGGPIEFDAMPGELGNVATTTNLATNTWYHIVGTYDGTTARIYVNGVDEASATASTMFNNNTNHIEIGKEETNRFNGTIDEVMMFNRSLVESEVKFLYESSREKVTAGGKQIQHIAEDANVSMVLSSPGTSFFDNIKVKKGEPKIRFLVPYDRVDIKDDARFGPGDHAIIIQNDGVNASNNNRPIIVLRE